MKLFINRKKIKKAVKRYVKSTGELAEIYANANFFINRDADNNIL